MRIVRLISHSIKITPKNPNPQSLGFSLLSNAKRSYNTAAAEQSQSQSLPPPPPLNTPSDKIAAIADEISNLTLMEVGDLTTLLGKKLEVNEMPLVSLMMPGMGFSLRGMGGAGGGAAGAAGAKKEEVKAEKTSFDLKLQGGFEPGTKIKIIKELRTFTDLGLKEAKALVEKAPIVLKSAVPKEDAEKIIEKMKAIGAIVVME